MFTIFRNRNFDLTTIKIAINYLLISVGNKCCISKCRHFQKSRSGNKETRQAFSDLHKQLKENFT